MLRHFDFSPRTKNSPSHGGADQNDNAIAPSFCNNDLRDSNGKISHERSVINAPFVISPSQLRQVIERGAEFVANCEGNSSGDQFSGSANTRGGAGAIPAAVAVAGDARKEAPQLSPYFHAVSGFRGRVL